MENERYHISQPAFSEVRIKRSVFLGALLPADTREAAEQVIAEYRSKYHDATHNCFAWRIDENEFRYSDDGEPSGTAGKPILTMLEKYGLIRCVLIVTRYYGGTKLGTGGLIRAYSQCAGETIENSQREKFVRYQRYAVQYPYNQSRNIHYFVTKFNGDVEDSQFEADVRSVVRIPENDANEFVTAIENAGEGQVILEEIT